MVGVVMPPLIISPILNDIKLCSESALAQPKGISKSVILSVAFDNSSVLIQLVIALFLMAAIIFGVPYEYYPRISRHAFSDASVAANLFVFAAFGARQINLAPRRFENQINEPTFFLNRHFAFAAIRVFRCFGRLFDSAVKPNISRRSPVSLSASVRQKL